MRPRLFFLRSPDEMRASYGKALSKISSKVEWYETLDQLIKKETQPSCVIVDLDCLPDELDPALELIQTRFPDSELIALSSQDSSQLGVKCLRVGFSEFLLKPVTPEELVWCLQKAEQQRETLSKLDARHDFLQAVTRLSGCQSTNLLVFSALDQLKRLSKAKGAAWLVPSSPGKLSVKCSLPVGQSPPQVVSRLPHVSNPLASRIHVFKRSKSSERKIVYVCRDTKKGAILLWGVPEKLTHRFRKHGEAISLHAEQCWRNLERFELIKQQNFVDDLTGLYNSRYLKFALSNSIAASQKSNRCFSVLFIDVDHFKKINDSKGHLVGSEFLVAIGKSVRNTVRGMDPVFRYGGDEFVVILQGSPLDEAKAVGERIRRNIEKRLYQIKGENLRSTVSIGIATYPDHTVDREMLLKLADKAMYSAKESRNAVHLAYGLEEASEDKTQN